MRILLVAPPGAGKGTQATRLASHFGIEHLGSGDLLRQEMATGSELGRQARSYVDRGDLVPDELIMRLVLDRTFAAAERGGYVLDGFPRTLSQAETAWDEARAHQEVGLQAVVHLAVPDSELRRRRKARAGEGRDDDAEAVFEHRLQVYAQLTAPLLEFYGDERGILVTIDGNRPVDAVTADILAALDPLAAPA